MSPGGSTCVGALAGQDLGLGNDLWLLGDRYASFHFPIRFLLNRIRSFMKNVYTVFDVNVKEVGFAQLSCCR